MFRLSTGLSKVFTTSAAAVKPAPAVSSFLSIPTMGFARVARAAKVEVVEPAAAPRKRKTAAAAAAPVVVVAATPKSRAKLATTPATAAAKKTKLPEGLASSAGIDIVPAPPAPRSKLPTRAAIAEAYYVASGAKVAGGGRRAPFVPTPAQLLAHRTDSAAVNDQCIASATAALPATATKAEVAETVARARAAAKEIIEQQNKIIERSASMIMKRHRTNQLSERLLIKDALLRGRARPQGWYAIFLKSLDASQRPEGMTLMSYAASKRAQLTDSEIAEFRMQAKQLSEEFNGELAKIPKRPLSGYARFFSSNFKSVPVPSDLSSRQAVTYVARELGAAWKALPEETKKEWAPAEEEKLAYKEAMKKLHAEVL